MVGSWLLTLTVSFLETQGVCHLTKSQIKTNISMYETGPFLVNQDGPEVTKKVKTYNVNINMKGVDLFT